MKQVGQQAGQAQPQMQSGLRVYLAKMKGGRYRGGVPRASLPALLFMGLGSFTGISLIAFLALYYELPLLLPSFGASAVLVYSLGHLPMAQPRNVVGGHMMSALMGVTVYQLFGGAWWVIALGVSLAGMAMSVTNTLHPPGGATAFIAVYTGQNFGFILAPVCLGAVILIMVALLINNLPRDRKYPDYWF